MSDHAVAVREDLSSAHRRSLEHVSSPGARFDGRRRREIAQVAASAYLDPLPPPPWGAPYDDPALILAWRLARHASTITRSWYDGLGLEPLDAVEVVGLVVAVVPVVSFRRAAGLAQLEFLAAVPGLPTGRVHPNLESAELNWVPVAAPADKTAAVLQALSALPDEWDNLWRLAAAQYMTSEQMDDPLWNRGTLARAQMELVAGRLSKLRDCFY